MIKAILNGKSVSIRVRTEAEFTSEYDKLTRQGAMILMAHLPH